MLYGHEVRGGGLPQAELPDLATTDIFSVIKMFGQMMKSSLKRGLKYHLAKGP